MTQDELKQASAPTCRRRRSAERMRSVLTWISLALASSLLPLDALALTCEQYSAYEVEGRLVYYQRGGKRRILTGIDIRTFLQLGRMDECMAGYAKDAHIVLYEGVRIQGALADSFKLIGFGWVVYAADSKRVYSEGRAISNAVDRFRTFKSGYATDGSTVFYGATRLLGKNLVDLGHSYAKTEMAVFYKGKALAGIGPATFQVFKNRPSYGRDSRRVVLDGEPIAGADPASFEIVAPAVDHARDRRNVYHLGKVVAGADPATIKQIYNYYFRDARAVYLEGRRIEGADPATFRVWKSGFHALDRSRVYRLHDVVPGIDPATFEELCMNERARNQFEYCR